MTKPAHALSWQEMRRTLASQSKNELLNPLRDLYALTTDNQDLIHAQVLTPKPTPPKARPPKKPPSSTAKVVSKIRRLAQIAAALRQGERFEVTRLTTLKSLCEDAQAAAQFALHLAKLTHEKMKDRACPSHLEPEQWDAYKGLVAIALAHMGAYVEAPAEQTRRAVWSVQSEARGVQNTYMQHQWGPVRMIHSTEVLLIEYALSCLLQPTASANWGYRSAREYAERYKARYGTERIPESAPLIEDMADFWCQYHMGKPVHAWLGNSSEP